MKLDHRLSLIASLVRKESRLADIGTDHAYLPVYLVEKGCCSEAIASDIHEGPVNRAKQTVSEAHLSDRISIRLGSGLITVQPDEVDDIVIAGMGGETIASILADAPWAKNAHYRFVLQPMTKPELLREYLLKNGFCLVEEHIAAENHHMYVVLCAEYHPEKAQSQLRRPAVFHRGILTKAEGQLYLNKLARHMKQIAAAQRKAGNLVQAEQFETTAFEIENDAAD